MKGKSSAPDSMAMSGRVEGPAWRSHGCTLLLAPDSTKWIPYGPSRTCTSRTFISGPFPSVLLPRLSEARIEDGLEIEIETEETERAPSTWS
jgi:hypothetical protein